MSATMYVWEHRQDSYTKENAKKYEVETVDDKVSPERVNEDDVVELSDSPEFHGFFAFKVEGIEKKSELCIFTNDRVHSEDRWDGPAENGTPFFPEESPYRKDHPYEVELWGRIKAYVQQSGDEE